MPAPALNAEVSAALHRCLSPDAAARPTASALRDILSGRGARVERPARPAPAPLVSDRIELRGPDGRSLQLGVRTELGKALVRQFGAEAEFWDDRQCVLERQTGRQWVVTPLAGTANETLVNGSAITGPRALQDGDSIAVGREAKGLVKLPLVARGR
jgi:eukaryotic-like serine/threonine-protein kinase